MRTDGFMNVIDFGTRKITYTLHREDRKRLRIVVAPDLTVDVFAPATADEDQIQAAVMKKAAWIASKLDALERYHPLPAPKKYISGETLGRYMEKSYAIASRHGVPEPVLLIRTMHRRWGSCSLKGRITLNLNLVKAPVHCIEYVIMHELCHLKYHNHSKSFYSLLTRCQPDWRKRKVELDKVVI